MTILRILRSLIFVAIVIAPLYAMFRYANGRRRWRFANEDGLTTYGRWFAVIPYLIQQGVLHTQPDDRLLRWLGPVLRRTIAAELRERVCLQPEHERATRWRFCSGCPHGSSCTYVATSQSSRFGSARYWGGDQPMRALVLSPEMVPRYDYWNGCLPFELLLTGEAAVAQRRDVVTCLAEAGTFRGFGMEEVPFELIDLLPPVVGELAACHLPDFPHASHGVVDRLTVRLNAPLFLRGTHRDRNGGKIEQPGFAELFAAAVQHLRSLFEQYSAPLDIDLTALQFAADQVRCEYRDYGMFRQSRPLRHARQRFEMRGVVGEARFIDVPMSLIPWMYWGGRFHVGQHRACGAGGWSLEMW